MPRAFRADVIAVARKGEAPLRQIAKDFGISEACLHRWLKIADREDGVGRTGAPTASDESVELREACKRIKLLEREAEVSAVLSAISVGTSTENDVPAGPRPCR